jgi:chorismate mutase/prephenate dehydrogenase
VTGEGIEHRRSRIREIDREIVDLVHERLDLAREIGREKREQGLPIRNYGVEAEVIRVVREACERAGVRPALGEDVVKLLIEESLRVQEADRRGAHAQRPATDVRALVIGGRGSMGAWFCEFLEAKGYDVTVSDPQGPLAGYHYLAEWPAHAGKFDLILIATPPSAVEGVLDRLLALRPRAVVFEIASLKSPFLKKLEELARAGLNVTSVHPMWGPRTDILASKNALVCSCGRPGADAFAKALFADTAANVVEIPVAEHDAYMASTLGLPHALNLVLGRALAQGPHPLPTLASMGGPTFTKQVKVASEVAGENKDLYYEIQRLNAHTPEVYAAIRQALSDLERSLADREAFRAYMRDCEAWFKEGSKRE